MSDQQTLPGFEEWPELGSNSTSNMPSFEQMLAKKMCKEVQPPAGFDPHAMMVNKHKVETGEVPVDTSNKTNYPEEDIKALEDFCQKHSVMGFSCGTMPPKLALMKLKAMIGYEDRPLEERIPIGYEKRSTPPLVVNASYPYQKLPDKRTLLSG